MTEERVLPHIPGPILAAASRQLPDPKSAEDKFMEVRVVMYVRYERMSSSHGKSPTNYFWTPDEARIVMGEEGEEGAV